MKISGNNCAPPTRSTAAIVVSSMCFISLQFSILHPSWCAIIFTNHYFINQISILAINIKVGVFESIKYF